MGKLAQTAKLPTSGCKLGRILDKHADDADREMLTDLFDSSKGSAAIAADVNNAYELSGEDRIGKETVRAHRGKACACGQA
ncbi:MAG TPA: hypothetical protein DCR15_15145 [Arthrobacter bacterium]|jgi:hypothetical protein|nr:hypothetical protein [Arthrobacter sp.]